ncbi:cation-independent mannose-6-phosphate receptor-like [Centruroides sculpturatus]|uniref:cation-independent mannose-6-phosphate receptor-like n=1 Tax=Centruroides sculpturatus TaxID=218467 RepID=UPI000C6D4E6A|nr:cation-independent mannose-6-phosphate receptor-like [Centruroides sculpturatus]
MDFIWRTSAACNSLNKVKEVPCYVYDKDGNKRDLTHLIQSKGHYSVESAYPSVEFYINVCSEIIDDEAPEGSAAYQKIGNEKITVGKLDSGVYLDGNDLKLVYNANSSSLPSGCTKDYRVVITFKCPPRGKSRNPRIVFIANCQYDIEWETEYACSEKILIGNFSKCTFTSMTHKIELDLSPLKKISDYYYIKSNETAFALNVCGGIGSSISCNNRTWKSYSVCMFDSKNNSEIIGTTRDAELRFVDGQITLTYPTLNNCSNTGTTKLSVIEFECDEEADDNGVGKPIFYMENNCKYIFKWKTKYACLTHPYNNNCYINDGNVQIDLGVLTKKNGPWNVVNTLDKGKSSFLLNVCSEIPSFNNSCEPGSAICKIVLDDNGVGKPIFYMENNCKYIFKWKTKYACLTHPYNNNCYINDGNVQIDLGVLTKKNGPWNVVNTLDKGKSSFLLNVCSEIPSFNNSCEPGSAICKIDENGKAISLGKSVSPPKYNKKFKTVELIYENGQLCEGGHYSTRITLYCKPGMLDSSPVLKTVTNKSCLYEIEWHTAAACPLKVKKGKDCKVFDDDLGFTVDLNPLKSDKNYEIKTDKYTYYLNVCGPVKGTKCDENEGKSQAAACQEESNGRFWKLGEPNSELFYVDGMINLTYAHGSPYNDENKTPRLTSVTFLCDHNAGIGKPEFIKEINQAYSFQWKTSYACPTSNVANCLLKNPKNGVLYDFSRLTKTVQEGNWIVNQNTNGKKRKFYLNVCQPLNPVIESCSSDSFACVIETNEEGDTSVHNLGNKMTELEFKNQGHLTVKYTSGDPCTSFGKADNYTTTIHFLCDQRVEELRFLNLLGNCEYMFLWSTEAACGVKSEISKNKCTIVDPLTEYTLDLQSLKSDHGYSVTADSRTFKLNICGTADGCTFEGKNVSVCELNEGKPHNILGLLNDYYLELSDDEIITLVYEGIFNQATGIVSKVYVELPCKQGVRQKEIKFIRQDGNAYFFELETSLSCFPNHIDCSFSDSFGNSYDLKSLLRWKNDNWEAVDIHSNDKYHINFCKPLNPTSFYTCPAGEVMSCQTSHDGKEGFSLGYIQEKPIVHSQGIITLKYKGGTLCDEGQFNRSTRINLKCSTVQKDLVFVGKTVDCVYIFSMDTPAACPIKNVDGFHCAVKIPKYEYTIDLSSLHQEIGEYRVKHKEYEYILNVCGEIKNASGKCKGAAVCQTKLSDTDFAINAGMPNSNLLYDDGVVQLIYESGKGNCHRKYNRSTVIIFTCDSSTNGAKGPIFLEEKEDCTYVFEWPTSLVCLPYSLHQCSVDDGDFHYDLSPLSLPDDNYMISHGQNLVFVINVCRSIVTKSGIQCSSSGACVIDYSDFTKHSKTNETSIGKASSPYIENGKLKLRYMQGNQCKLFSGEETNMETVIEFECEKKNLDSEPQFIGMENCTYYFSWSTAYACPVEDKDDSENCVVENPTTGFKYNLSSLKKVGSYEVMTSNSEHKYYLNVCGAIKNSTCGPNVGSCQEDEESNKRWNAGLANSKLNFHEGVLTLNYSGGDICHGKYSRHTIIEFKCGSGEGKPMFQFESEDCTYYFIWSTSLACENKKHCIISNGSESYDLTPLSKSTYTVNDLTGKNDLYYLSVCDSVNINGIGCPPDAGICKINKVNKSATSLGIPTSPMIDFEGYVTILYPFGSLCENGKKKLTSRIKFICDTSTEMGEPELITSEEDCHYEFEWKTNLVCPKSNITENPSVINCVYRDANKGIDIDLSPLRKVNSSYVVKSKRNTYLLNICGSVNSSKSGCSSAAVCRQVQHITENENFGSVNSASLSYNAETLTLNYAEGGSCIMSSSRKRFTNILFSCNPKAGTGEPKVLKETACFAVFKWETNLVCRSYQRPCSFNAQGQHYDFQLLSSLSHDWNTTDSEGNIYWLNLCRETKINKDYLTCQNSPVCRKDTKGNVASLGKSQSQEFHIDSNHNILLSYADGSDSVCPRKNTYAKTNIKFICGNTLSTPKYTSGPNDECVFEFLWKTRIACAEENLFIFNCLGNHNILLSYADGSDSVCPRKNTYAKTNIKFICGNTLSTPKYTSGPNDECVFEFLWKTRIACAEEKKEVRLEKNGIIYEPRLNMNIDLSPLLNKTYFIEGIHHDETYIYVINIQKGTGAVTSEACQNAAVCQTKQQEKFFRDIGSLATRTFYLKGTELQLELTSLGRKCGKNENKNVTTIINFVCVEDAGEGRPLFYYESGNCDYLFEWETALACVNNFKSVTDYHSASDETEKVSASVTAHVIVALLFTGIFLSLIIFIVSKEERRYAVKHKVSRIFSYISSSKCFRRNDSESLPLSSSVITAYHDDSDVEILT